MSVFQVTAEHLETGEQRNFFVDNKTLLISESEFPYGGVEVCGEKDFSPKKPPYSNVRIQLGLKCNFSCGYCQQQNLADEKQFSLSDLDGFIEKFVKLKFTEAPSILFWGGEPLVYWKYIKRMMPELKARIPNVNFGTITNGALLTREIVDFLAEHRCYLAISHDGPGQHVRGSDPLETNRDAIAYAIETLLPLGLFSFSSMIGPKNNPSRLAVINFFKERFPEFDIPSTEMGVLKTTGPETHDFVRMTKAENFDFRRNLWAEMRFHSSVRKSCRYLDSQVGMLQAKNMGGTHGQDLSYLGKQRCGLDREGQLAVDLEGNLLTCHNTSKSTVSASGKTHVIGNLFDDEPAVITEATPWAERERCSNCPVFAFCQGACMLLQGDEWDLTCELEYAEKITSFAVGFEQVTGFVPVEILDESLPLHRRDIWGSIYQHEEPAKKKVIPISVVTNKS